MRAFIVAALTALLAACATNPATIAISPQSEKALLIMEVGASPIDFQLGLAPYDAEAGAIHGWTQLWVPQSSVKRYFVRELQPGRYAFMYLAQQEQWAVCFHADTQAFDVRPGEVIYLGAFDPRPHLLQLQGLAVSSGRTYAQGSTLIHFFDNITPPALLPPQEEDLARVQTYLSQTSPLVTAPIRRAEYQPAAFGTGRDLFGLERVCGGYYAQGTRTQQQH